MKKKNQKKPKKAKILSKKQSKIKESNGKNERLYPELNYNQELAILKIVGGKKTHEIIKEIGISANTYYNWRKEEGFRKALEEEQVKSLELAKDSHSRMITLATEKVLKALESDKLDIFEFAYILLKDSGYLPSSISKNEKEKLAKELAGKLINLATQQ